MRRARTLDQYLSPEQVSDRLAVSVRFVRERIARGEFCRARRVGALVRIPESDVAAWMERQPSALAPVTAQGAA